jgi:hypothetical protein
MDLLLNPRDVAAETLLHGNMHAFRALVVQNATRKPQATQDQYGACDSLAEDLWTSNQYLVLDTSSIVPARTF